jgi:hypothetical protein
VVEDDILITPNTLVLNLNYAGSNILVLILASYPAMDYYFKYSAESTSC